MTLTSPNVVLAVSLACRFGGQDGTVANKQGIVDQMLRALLGSGYSAWREEYDLGGEFGAWSEGVPFGQPQAASDGFDTTDAPVHLWFELTYSAYLVVQRSVLQAMPVEWQRRFVRLLNQIEQTLDVSDVPRSFRVLALDARNRFVSDPYRDYRHGRRPQRKTTGLARANR
jgi:hypothetical protein